MRSPDAGSNMAYDFIKHKVKACLQYGQFHKFMVTSSNGNFSALLAFCAGNSPITGEFPSQRPVTRSFDVIFDLRLNKRLNKDS